MHPVVLILPLLSCRFSVSLRCQPCYAAVVLAATLWRPLSCLRRLARSVNWTSPLPTRCYPSRSLTVVEQRIYYVEYSHDTSKTVASVGTQNAAAPDAEWTRRDNVLIVIDPPGTLVWYWPVVEIAQIPAVKSDRPVRPIRHGSPIFCASGGGLNSAKINGAAN